MGARAFFNAAHLVILAHGQQVRISVTQRSQHRALNKENVPKIYYCWGSRNEHSYKSTPCCSKRADGDTSTFLGHEKKFFWRQHNGALLYTRLALGRYKAWLRCRPPMPGPRKKIKIKTEVYKLSGTSDLVLNTLLPRPGPQLLIKVPFAIH